MEHTINTNIALTVPTGATNVLIVHEWSDILVNYASCSGTYNFIPDSVGMHTVYWCSNVIVSPLVTIQLSASPIANPITTVTGSTIQTVVTNPSSSTTTATYVGQTNFIASLPLISSADFFNDLSSLDNSTNEDAFTYVERLVRLYLERYTQQKFGPYINKTLQIQGESGSDLALPYQMLVLRNLKDCYGNDLTDKVQISTTSPYFLHHRAETFYLDNSVDIGYVDRKRDVSYRGRNQFFSKNLNFLINADYGYYFVPQDVVEAAKLVIADTFTGAQDMRRAGIQQAQLGDYSYQLARSGDGTTGNLLADQLLSSYLNINLGLA